MQKLEELKSFIKQNSYGIYQYINQEVLKDIGVMNADYFVKLVNNILVENSDNLNENNIPKTNNFPYVIFTLMFGKGVLAYTSLRKESIDFSQINKEAKAYYNYAKFTIENNSLVIQLMQEKIGGMPIDADIVKFEKIVPIIDKGLEQFIQKNAGLYTDCDESIKMNGAINKIL